jgi:serine protease Do
VSGHFKKFLTRIWESKNIPIMLLGGDIRRTLKATQLATYSVDLPNPKNMDMPSPTGTGFFVSPDGWFVTAAHVITQNNSSDGPVRTDIEKAWLMKEARPGEMTSGMCQAVKFEYIDPKTDFALLKVDFDANANKQHLKGLSGFPFIEVSSRELEEGEPVYAFGYPLSASSVIKQTPEMTFGHAAHSPRVTSAIVASTMESTKMFSSNQDTKVYVLDKALNYGNSGGPIVASDTGKVHGICSRFVPVKIKQHDLKDQHGNAISITIPSLYGVVISLSNQNILDQLRSRGVSISDS